MYENKCALIVEIIIVFISMLQYVVVLCYAILLVATIIREEPA